MLLQRNRQKVYRQSKHQQRGVVIVMALFLVALVATMAYVMMSRLTRDTERTQLILRHDEAEMYASGSVAWAQDELRNHWEKQKNNTLIDVMPLHASPQTINNYTVESAIFDVQNRFNLNNVKDPESQAGFMRLLVTVLPKISGDQAKAIAENLTDWISPQSQRAELTKYYLELPESYRPGHRPMANKSELRLVKGVTPAIYLALEPYMIALPPGVQPNIQTADIPVLMSLDPMITVDVAKTIISQRAATPILNAQAFANLDLVKNRGLKLTNPNVVSQYFLLQTDVSIENEHTVIYTLLERSINSANKNKAMVNVLWQSKGIW